MNPTIPSPRRFPSGSTATRARNLVVRTLLWLLIASLVAACGRWGNEATKVKIIFTETDPARRLVGLTVYEAGDSFYFHHLKAGEVETINLLAEPEDPRQLSLTYRLDSDPVDSVRRGWDGPKFDRGTGYRIEIKINGRGEVTERHCILPCSLD